MRCGSCGWDNPAGIIFCTNCGKRMSDRAQPPASAGMAPPLAGPSNATPPSPPFDAQTLEGAPRCSRCGALGQRGMRFCRECGGALVAPAPPGPVAAVPPSFAQPDATPASGGGELPSLPAPPPRAREPATCWRCQGTRDPGAAFCRHCGAPSAEAAQVASPALAAPAAASPSYPRATPEPGASPAAGARLVTLLKDGSEGRSIPLGTADSDIGSREGDITFPDDPFLSPRHARLACRAGAYTLRDLDSVNGVYVRLRDVVELRDRDMVLIGQQVLRFELLQDGELPLGPAWQRGVLVFGTPEAQRFARLVQYTTEGVGRDVHYLFRDETVIGRENGDIVFTDDPFLSRRHAAIRVDHAGRRFTLHDLGSSNGTAIRIRGEHVLRDGDQFRIGRHLFRFEAGSSAGGRAGR